MCLTMSSMTVSAIENEWFMDLFLRLFPHLAVSHLVGFMELPLCSRGTLTTSLYNTCSISP